MGGGHELVIDASLSTFFHQSPAALALVAVRRGFQRLSRGSPAVVPLPFGDPLATSSLDQPTGLGKQ